MYPEYRIMIKNPDYSFMVRRCDNCGKVAKSLGEEKYNICGKTETDIVHYLNCKNCGHSFYEA